MAGRIWKVTKLTLLSVLALIVVLAAGGLGYRALSAIPRRQTPWPSTRLTGSTRRC